MILEKKEERDQSIRGWRIAACVAAAVMVAIILYFLDFGSTAGMPTLVGGAITLAGCLVVLVVYTQKMNEKVNEKASYLEARIAFALWALLVMPVLIFTAGLSYPYVQSAEMLFMAAGITFSYWRRLRIWTPSSGESVSPGNKIIEKERHLAVPIALTTIALLLLLYVFLGIYGNFTVNSVAPMFFIVVGTFSIWRGILMTNSERSVPVDTEKDFSYVLKTIVLPFVISALIGLLVGLVLPPPS